MSVFVKAVLVALAAGTAGLVSASEVHPVVPPRYQALFGQLSRTLSDYERRLDQNATPPGHAVWGGELLVANGNRGEELLKPGAIAGVRLFLDRFQQMGLRGATVSVCFPLLTSSFPRHAEYTAYYREVAREVRQRGMSLVVKSSVLFANTPFSKVSFDWSSLTWSQFVAARREQTEVILTTMMPDWLDIGAEPDVEARLTGKAQLNDPSQRTQMVNAILSGLRRGQTRLAAGIGTWGDLAFVRLFLERTSLDAIAIHVYPLDTRSIQTAAQAASMARAAGKEVLLDECWLYKAGPEDSTTIADNAAVFKRDVWSFWTPLDRRFLRCMDRFSRQAGVSYVSPFWSHQYFTYLPYDEKLDAQSYPAVNGAFLQKVLAAVLAGSLSPTGQFVADLLEDGAP